MEAPAADTSAPAAQEASQEEPQTIAESTSLPEGGRLHAKVHVSVADPRI